MLKMTNNLVHHKQVCFIPCKMIFFVAGPGEQSIPTIACSHYCGDSVRADCSVIHMRKGPPMAGLRRAVVVMHKSRHRGNSGFMSLGFLWLLPRLRLAVFVQCMQCRESASF